MRHLSLRFDAPFQARLWLMVGVLLLAFGLRVWLLADTNLNWDEGYSAWIHDLPLATLLDTTARDVHPPLYYLYLRASSWFFGDGVFGLRFGSVLAGVLMVTLAYRLGRAVGGGAVGVVAALLLALARSNVHISQLARMHILAALLATGALWAAARLWAHPDDRRAMAAYVLCAAGALYSFYLAVMLPIAVNAAYLLLWLWRGRRIRPLVAWVALQVAAAALFAPWAWYASQRMFGWTSEQATPFGFFTQFYASTLAVGRPTFDPAQLPYVLAYFGAALAGGGALLWARRTPTDNARLVLLLAGVITPAVIVFLLALPFHSLGRPLAARYMLPLAACFYVLAAWGVGVLWGWRRAAGGAALLVLVGVAAWGMSNIADGAIRRDNMQSIAQALNALRRDTDAVVLHNDKTWTTLAAHYDGSFVDVPQAEPVTPWLADVILEPLHDDHTGIWVITTPAAAANDPNANLVGWLAGRNPVSSQVWTFNDHTLGLYTFSPCRARLANTLAPGADVPRAYAAPAAGLLGVQRSVWRAPLGDSLNMALYWDTPPTAPFTVTLHPPAGDPIPQTMSAPAPAATGPTRQHIRLPLLPAYPAGRYTISLTLGEGTYPLGWAQVVQLHPDATADANAIGTPTDTQLRPAGADEPLVALRGYTLPRPVVQAGDDLEVTLYWEALAPVLTRYKVSVFLLGESINPATGNPLYAQVDTEPVNWTLPTTLWSPGDLIADPYVLPVAPGTPPGTYTLGVVVYNPTSGQRLQTSSSTDMITLTPVTVR